MDGELQRRVARLQKGDHLCLIFDSAAEQAAALTAFLKAGLSSRERCLWMAGTASSRRLERALDTAGVDVERELERGALVLLSERRDWLLSSHFDPGQMLDLLRRAEQQALDDGFAGLRVAWDMEWLLEDDPGAGRLVELEAHLNGFLQGSRTTILCQYSRARSSAELVHGVLRTHPLALLGERLCPNAYYEPPALVLGDLSPDERIDWMIAKLLQARANERKLEEVTRRLAQNGAALKRADRAKEELLAMLAHELRNPLGTISNALQVLRLKSHAAATAGAEETDETWKRAIDAAERQVHHQALLVDDLLEASRVTRGEIELNCERLDLVQVTSDTVEGYRETLRNAGLALDVELPAGPVPVHGDRLRLSQAISNLLHNATKFTAPGGKISVRLSRGNHRAEISVSDTGVGISPEVLPHVFEVFSQADHSLDRAQGGLGVGLAVVRGLIEMHGGEVEAHSPGAGQGAELRLRLPLLEEDLEEGLTGHPAHGEAAAAHGEEPHPDSARRILVVEDNPDHAATMRDFLELSGHQVELASSGTDGVAAAREFHPEVVLCDLGLPGMNGFEVAAELRRDPSTASAQLIAVTGYGGEDDRRRSREAGFDLHLTKPVDPGQLKRVLQAPAAPAAPVPANTDTLPASEPAQTGRRA